MNITPWFYLGESVQKGWMYENYEYYSIFDKRDYTEAETRIIFSHGILENEKIKLKGFALAELSYDFHKKEGVRNELVAGVILPINKNFEAELNWRHIDRVHYYDSDVVETALTLIF
ncbi:MAG: hypothetical protein DRP74_07450 [Candidatus Omnitrophota bacterium]|nr:MAG: hypothetical protein DRP74_07450 [Candidatus Omnitrophota bacterium]